MTLWGLSKRLVDPGADRNIEGAEKQVLPEPEKDEADRPAVAAREGQFFAPADVYSFEENVSMLGKNLCNIIFRSFVVPFEIRPSPSAINLISINKIA